MLLPTPTPQTLRSSQDASTGNNSKAHLFSMVEEMMQSISSRPTFSVEVISPRSARPDTRFNRLAAVTMASRCGGDFKGEKARSVRISRCSNEPPHIVSWTPLSVCERIESESPHPTHMTIRNQPYSSSNPTMWGPARAARYVSDLHAVRRAFDVSSGASVQSEKNLQTKKGRVTDGDITTDY